VDANYASRGEEIMAVEVDVTVEKVAVFVDILLDEQLVYRVTVRGAQPIFTLVDSQTKQLLMSHDDNPVDVSPDVIFERRWPSSDPTQPVTGHTMGFQFLGAISYRYEVTREASDGTSDTIIDITYSSTAPEDVFFQDLQVSTE
jgi:hypothetical protein